MTQEFPKFDFRLVNTSDEETLLIWRNDRETRTMSFSTKDVKPEEHHNWLEKSLHDPNRKLLIGMLGDTQVGTVRFDMIPNGSFAEISITLAPDMRGKHLSGPLIKASCEYYFESLGKRIAILAEIKPKNIKSVRAFEYAGFEFVEKSDECLKYLLRVN